MNALSSRDQTDVTGKQKSKWDIPAKLLVLSPLSFIYLNIQLRKRKYKVFAILYAIPLFLFFSMLLLSPTVNHDGFSALLILTGISWFFSSLVSFFHVSRVKHEFGEEINKAASKRKVELVKKYFSDDEEVIRNWIMSAKVSHYKDKRLGRIWYITINSLLAFLVFFFFTHPYYYFFLAMNTRSKEYFKIGINRLAIKIFLVIGAVLAVSVQNMLLGIFIAVSAFFFIYNWMAAVVHYLTLRKEIMLKISMIMVLNSRGIYINDFDRKYHSFYPNIKYPEIRDDV